jgi:hypothetical protein
MKIATLLTLEEDDRWMLNVLRELSSMLGVRFNEEMLALYGDKDLGKILHRVEDNGAFTTRDVEAYRDLLRQTAAARIALHTCHPSPLGAAIIAQTEHCLSRLNHVLGEMHTEAQVAAQRELLERIKEHMDREEA